MPKNERHSRRSHVWFNVQRETWEYLMVFLVISTAHAMHLLLFLEVAEYIDFPQTERRSTWQKATGTSDRYWQGDWWIQTARKPETLRGRLCFFESTEEQREQNKRRHTPDACGNWKHPEQETCYMSSIVFSLRRKSRRNKTFPNYILIFDSAHITSTRIFWRDAADRLPTQEKTWWNWEYLRHREDIEGNTHCFNKCKGR